MNHKSNSFGVDDLMGSLSNEDERNADGDGFDLWKRSSKNNRKSIPNRKENLSKSKVDTSDLSSAKIHRRGGGGATQSLARIVEHDRYLVIFESLVAFY